MPKIRQLEFLLAPHRLEAFEDEVHVWRVDLRTVTSWPALREILGRYLGLPANELRFERSRHGKPRLASPGDDLAFNLSHSSSLALVAVARREVGVDVERFRAKRPIGFYRRWADREARVKCLGTGLTGAVPPDAPEPAVQRLDVGPDYAASIAVSGPPAVLRCWTFDPPLRWGVVGVS
jgi:phosphopantetheinyl transferase